MVADDNRSNVDAFTLLLTDLILRRCFFDMPAATPVRPTDNAAAAYLNKNHHRFHTIWLPFGSYLAGGFFSRAVRVRYPIIRYHECRQFVYSFCPFNAPRDVPAHATATITFTPTPEGERRRPEWINRPLNRQ